MPPVGRIRKDLVEKFRNEILNKKYKIKSKEIASKMAKELFSTKSSSGRIDLKL